MPNSKHNLLIAAWLLLGLVGNATCLAQSSDARPSANQPARVASVPVDIASFPGHRVEESGAVPPIPETGYGESDQDPFISAIAEQAQVLSNQTAGGSMIQTALMLGAIGLAPAILLLTTCYIRIFVVFSLLRQALGAQQLPPTQVLMAVSICVTILVMSPVWMTVKQQAIDPALSSETDVDWQAAWQRGAVAIKQFMVRQIQVTGNRQAVEVFYQHGVAGASASAPTQLEDVPINVILPAFILSELKIAFLLGFQVVLPFLILDLVVATATVSLGMVMLPPAMVSLPLKLMLFVMVDGWNLVIGMLIQSLGPLS
ncbi:MAG TPA: flagellar type III secretion system pore protein FliP [Pirellulaceae bacterium]|nr:flagellar type III secretion system pore protein FliP [Pirellulaceae bacterium]